jgi:anthranilate/para-aminobenzoate synthase component I
MNKEDNNYHIAFVGYEPEHTIKNTNQQARIYFKKDTLHFISRQQQEEFLDNIEKIVEHIKNSDVLKLLLDKKAKGKLLSPIVNLMLYYQSLGSSRIYFNETREIDVGLGRVLKKVENKYETLAQRNDIALMTNLFKK